MSGNKDDNYEIAQAYLKNEHTRWNSWALLYLGIIASILISLNDDKLFDKVPPYVPFLFCSFVSFLWLLTNLNIMASTKAWHNALLNFNKNKESDKIDVFHEQHDEFEGFSRWETFWSSFGIMRHFCGNICYPWFLRSVTRTLLLLSTSLTILFLGLSINAMLSQHNGTNHKTIKLIAICSPLLSFILMGIIIKIIECYLCFKTCPLGEKLKVYEKYNNTYLNDKEWNCTIRWICEKYNNITEQHIHNMENPEKTDANEE